MRNLTSAWTVLLVLLATITYALAEDLTLTTYYPSPRGVYDELQSATLTLSNPGDATINGGLAVGPTYTPGAAGTAIFEGNVGIRTTNLTAPLSVAGDVNLSGGKLLVDLDEGLCEQTEQACLFARSEPTGPALSLITGAASRLYIDPAGFVGVGTPDPVAKLHIQEVAANIDEFRVQSTVSPSAAILVRDGKVNVGVTTTVGAASLNVWEGPSNATPLRVVATTTGGPAVDVDYSGPGLQAARVMNRTAGGTSIVGEQSSLLSGTTGVWGIGDNGVRGSTFGSGKAIWGDGAIGGYAGYFEGNVRVTTGYLQIPTKTTVGQPPPGDCNETGEAGRMILQASGGTSGRLWLCQGVTGWFSVAD